MSSVSVNEEKKRLNQKEKWLNQSPVEEIMLSGRTTREHMSGKTEQENMRSEYKTKREKDGNREREERGDIVTTTGGQTT